MIPNSLASRRFFMVLLAIWLSLYGFAVPARALDSPVGLAWDANSDPGVVGYNVYRTESSGNFPSYPLNSAPLTSTSFSDLTAQSDHTYYYTVTAINSSGLESGFSNTVNITPSSANQAPSVNAGPDQTITLPGSANLSAVATDDGLPGGALTYRWSVISGSGVTFAYQAASTQASFAASGTYTLRVTASDGQLSSSDDLVVTVKPAANNAPAGGTQTINLPSGGSTPTTQAATGSTNTAPVVSSGPSQVVALGARVSLAGTATDDGLPNGQLTYQWSVVQGTGVVFTTPQSLTTDATFPAVGTYMLRITASDGELSTANDLWIVVQPASNQPPKVSAGPTQSITLPANANLVATVTDDGLPSGKLTYEWTVAQGTGVAFTNPRAAATAATFAAAGSYVIRVTVSDGELSSSADVTINVDTPVVVDFLRIQSQTTPSLELELMDYKRNQALVSDAVFQGGAPIKSGRIYAVVQGPLNTGIAFSNPNSQSVVINFNFADEAGSAIYTSQVTLAAGAKTSTFLSESPLRPTSGIQLDRIRSFTFSASAPIAAAAVRTLTNESGDFLIAALPIADLSQATSPVVLPFYGDGAGWRSEIQLVNTTDSNLKGTLQFFPSLNGSGSDLIYDIPARSAVAISTPGTGSQVKTGWVQVTPNPGTPSPAGWLILSNVLNGVTRTMVTVPATPAFPTYRIYAKTSGANRGQPGSSETGITLTNPSSTPASVNLELLSLNWQSTGKRGTLTIGPKSNVTMQLNQVPGMENIDTSFEGILQLSGAPVSAQGWIMRYSDVGELVVTAIPAINTSLRTDPWFLFTASGGGIETQMKDVHSLGSILQMTSQQSTSTTTTTTSTTSGGKAKGKTARCRAQSLRALPLHQSSTTNRDRKAIELQRETPHSPKRWQTIQSV
jgi:hypothetical protein